MKAENLIMNYLKLNKTESLVFVYLLKQEENIDVVNIKNYLNKERTTIQKILFKLVKRNLIYKRQLNLSSGFKFIYGVVDKERLKDCIKEDLLNTYNNSIKVVEGL